MAAAEAKAETRVRRAISSKNTTAVASTPPQFPATRAAPATVALRRSSATKRLVETQRLALPDDQADDVLAASPPSTSTSTSATVSARPRPLPEPDLIVPVASIQVALATAAALVGAALLIASEDSAFWALALTVIAGGGGSLGYLLAQRRHSLRAAGYALLLAQLGMLAWLLAIVGPRASVLALAPIVALLTLRMSGRVAALAAIAGALAIYAVASALALAGLLSPAIDASAGMLALLDGVLAGLGLLGTLAGALDLQARKARAEAAAPARRYELRMRRARVAELRQQVEDDADELMRALSEALRGTGITPPQVRGPLSPLAEGVVSAAERLATLQQDREDRIRIEAALRAVTREVERAWLGLPWVWPQASGTALDELVALLRAPRPTNTNTRTPWAGETLTPVPLPTLDTAPVPRISASSASASVPDLSRLRPRAPVLPWSEWDEWRGWDPNQVRDGT
jgi:hypothetical protein